MEKYANDIDKYVLYAPLTSGIKAYVENYFRIILNINSVDIIGNLNKKEKENIFKSYLLILMLKESFHFIFKLNKKGIDVNKALSPKIKKVDEYYQEIGVDLILEIFGTEYINFISPESSDLINRLESWKNNNTNFKVFDKIYISNGKVINEGKNKKFEIGLECNIFMDKGNFINFDINFNHCDTIKCCF